MAALGDERVSAAIGKQQVFHGGSGPALVYLHSASGETPGFGALEDLAGDHEVFAPLFPGFGDSEGIEQIDDVEDAAFHLLDVLDQVGVAQPAVVGQSLGGWLALELATRWPERVARLVLVNPVGLHVDGAPIREIFGRDPGELADDLFADQEHPLAVAMHQMSAVAAAGAEIPFDLVRPVLQSLAATARLGWKPYLHNPKLPRRLHRVGCPVLVVRGAADRLVPEAHARRLLELLPDARLAEVPGAGHLLAYDRPAELVRLVRGFVGDRGV